MTGIRLIRTCLWIPLIWGSTLWAADREWTGSTDSDWHTAGNWSPSDVPEAGESVLINSGTVLLTNDTAELGAVTITNATLTFSNWTTRLRAVDVTVRSNAVITVANAFNDTTDMSNRVHLVCSNLTVDAGGAIDVSEKGFRGNNGNTAQGLGPGKGYYGRGGGAGHGGRGGFSAGNKAGGLVYGSRTAPATPGSSGAGGGNTAGAAGGGVVRVEASGTVLVDGTIAAKGGNGSPWGTAMQSGCGAGGSIWITCATLGGDGEILADGGSGASYSSSGAGSAGGGGRIALFYDALDGSPLLRVSSDAGWDGRYFETTREFPAQVMAAVGYGQDARPGTVHLSDDGLLSPTLSRLAGYLSIEGATAWSSAVLTFSNTVVGFGNGMDLDVSGDIRVTGDGAALISGEGSDIACSGKIELENGGQLRLLGGLTSGGDIRAAHADSRLAIKGTNALHCGGNLVLTNAAAAYFHAGATNGLGRDYGLLVSVTGNVIVASNAWIHPYSQLDDGGSCLFRMAALTIDANGGFNADEKGFWGPNSSTGYGPGAGKYVAGGGGYGGKGGGSSSAIGGNVANGGIACGSTNAPIMPGFAGAGQANISGPNSAPGGGLIRIEASGMASIHGTITADGSPPIFYNSTQMRGGCGSGGGIFILCDAFEGTGVLSAKGGTGEGTATTLLGGGGGGGRISVGIGLSASDQAKLLADEEIEGLNVVDNNPDFSGTVSVQRGIGYTNEPPYGAEDGTLRFLTLTEAGFFNLSIAADPAQYGSPSERTYGFYANIEANTWITNQITTPANEAAGERWVSLGWHLEDDLEAFVDSGATTQAVFQLTTNLNLTWLWTNQYELGVSPTDPEQGGVNSDVVNGWYTNGVTVTGIEATPSNGYAFSVWSGSGVPDGAETDNPLTVTMDQARTINANFSLPGGQTRTWNGDGEWANVGNWTPAGFPGTDDNLIFASGTCILSDARQVNAVVISNSATLMFTNWNAVLTASNVVVAAGGTVTVANAFNDTTDMSNRVHLVCSNLTVDAGGAIDVSEKGYRGNNGASAQGLGPGKGYTVRGGGAGHGGRGGFSTGNKAGGQVYGLRTAPATPGSSGAGGGNTEGAAGGGVVRIEASGTIRIDGRIDARGGTGGIHGGGMQAGAGAGGSIWITGVTLGGDGEILADGGTGEGYNSSSGGAGGGGRIALLYDALDGSPLLRVSSDAGWDGRSFETTREFPSQVMNAAGYGQDARPGTVHLSDTGLLSPTLNRLAGYLSIEGETAWSPAGLTVSNTVVGFGNGLDLDVSGDIRVTGDGAALISDEGSDIVCSGKIALENGGQLRLLGGLTSGGDILAAHADSLLAIKGTNALHCGGNLTLTNEAAAYFHSGATNGLGRDYGLLVSVTGNVTIASNSWIHPYSELSDGGSCRFVMNRLFLAEHGGFDANGNGYWGVSGGSGFGPGRGVASGGGAGYGGAGGDTYWGGSPGDVYGSTNRPVQAGSGGSAHANAPWPASGGGLVWIEAGDSVILDGIIRASGEPGGLASTDMRGGCGSGGGIFIRTQQFSGSGRLQANGGSGEDTAATLYTGGGGGGGRIAVWYGDRLTDDTLARNIQPSSEAPAPFTGNAEATPGIGYDTGDPATIAQTGSVVFVRVLFPRGMMMLVR